jgi:hypothetical protein
MTTLTTAEKSKPWVTTRRLIAALYVYASWYVPSWCSDGRST